MTKQPSPLQQGDKVTLVATARSVTPELIEPSVRLLESWGLRVSIPDHLFDCQNQFAGSDELRRDLLQQALNDTDSHAILCAKGGYGSVRIIDELDFKPFIRHPQWVIGFSDVTVLHSHIHQLFGIETLHATMPTNIPFDATTNHYPSIDTLHRALFGESLEYSIAPHPLNRDGESEAQVVGGNLSILYSLMGSRSQIDTRGKILMIEDLDEYLYHIDRMMQGLRRCGMLEGLSGLIVGAMSDMHDNTVAFGSTAYEIIRHTVEDYHYPVVFGAPFGHTGTDNCAIPLGRQIHLQVGPNLSQINIPPSCC